MSGKAAGRRNYTAPGGLGPLPALEASRAEPAVSNDIFAVGKLKNGFEFGNNTQETS